MPVTRSPKRSPSKKAISRSYKLTNVDHDNVQDGGSISVGEIVEGVKLTGSELNSPRGKRCASYVIRQVNDFKRRGLLEDDPDSSEESDVKYRLTEKGLRKYRKALEDIEQPGVHAGTREIIRFAQDLRHRIFPPAELVIEKLYRKMGRLERRNPHTSLIDTDDESDDMDVEEDETASNAGDFDITLVEDADAPNAPVASSSRVTLDNRNVTPPLSQRLSAHGSYNEQHLLSPPFSDGSDHESQFTPTPQSLYTPPEYPVDFDMFDIPGSYGSVNDGDDDNAGAGDFTMVEPEIDLMAVNDKLAGIKASEPEPEYMNQCVSTESVADADVGVQAPDNDDNAPSQRPLALRFCVKYALAQRTVDVQEMQLVEHERALEDAEVTIHDLRLENTELREQVADREAVIGFGEEQRAGDAEAHRVALEQRDEWVSDALEGQAVVHAELVDKVGMLELLKGKYDAVKVKLSRFQEAFGGIRGHMGTVADMF